MELRMSQPPPSPAPFDGDPAQYLWFRANFRDQVESKTSVSDSAKMQRFGQNAMITEVLNSSIINGPRIKAGDSGALLPLSDKIQNCCWAMIELQSSELNSTTNLTQIYYRLPGHLQGKW